MSILNKFTLKSLKLNSKRTIATAIGIILSTALICAVAGVFSSFQQTLIKHAIELDGSYHAVFYDVPKEKQKYITENRDIKETYITHGVGYSKLEGSKNDYKPFLYLMEFDEKALNNWGLKIKEGRLPQNSKEVVISEHIEENAGVKYNVGDKITLNIGQRISEGEKLNQNNPYNNPKDSKQNGYVEEQLEPTETKEFTVVGIINRPNMEIESYSAPGYTVITKLDHNVDNDVNILVKYENINDTYTKTKELSEKLGNITYHENSELLRWAGISRSNDTMEMLFTLAGIVILIIIVSSVFVIKNSFDISITEKMKQYGMLSSIGATKKQIKKNVLFEGMALGIISVPIGILCGILATFILMQVTTILVGKSFFSNEIKFVFNIPILAIILSIVLGFLTIYLSCIFSARKASKITPINAIRSNEDIKIKSKKIKSPKIIKKIFGIGGEIAYKNLKRNKKKYRTTVSSLVVSIMVFIALSTFMIYAFDMSGIYYNEMDYNVMISMYPNTNEDIKEEKIYKYYQNIVNTHNEINKYTIERHAMIVLDNPESKMTEEYKKIYEEDKSVNEGYEFSIPITTLGEKEYREYVKELGGKYEDYKDGIIYYNNSQYYGEDNKKIDTLIINKNDEISGKLQETQNKVSLRILKITDKAPMGISSSTFGMFLVSDELLDSLPEYTCKNMKIDTDKPNEICESIKEEYNNSSLKGEYKFNFTNYKESADENNKMVLLISIFLYGFITVITLIGVTNIFNTITTNMNLRSKEFAMLKSIGMTKKEFNNMIRLESIFYGLKSLIIGIALGLGLSYWMYSSMVKADATSGIPFVFPTMPIIISIIFIFIIVGIIMRYSLNKINKQNIIETIRKDNI